MSLSVLQTATGSSTGSTTTTVTFSALTAGSALIIAATYPGGNSAVISGVGGVGGSTWSDAYASDHFPTNFLNIEHWISLNVAGGATSVAVTHPSSYGLKTVTVLEVAGMVTSGTTTDGTNSTVNSHVPNPISSGSITPSAGVDVLLIAAYCGIAAITSPPSGFTAIPISGTTANEVAYKIVAAPSGAYNTIWAVSAPQYSANLLSLVAFKAAGGGAPAPGNALFFGGC